MTQEKRLDNILDGLDLVREDIGELDLDRAVQRMAALLSELVSVNAGARRGEPLESATTFTKPSGKRLPCGCIETGLPVESLERGRAPGLVTVMEGERFAWSVDKG